MSTVLAKMAVQISANTAEFNKALQSTSNNLKSFTSGLTQIAGTIGLAFSAQQVAAFALEVSKLSGQAEAVRIAFERLPNSIKLMNELKAATGGTVSELELMKRAVQASNFDISLEALPRLLEFATLRAQQTGQSVDYLVDSIVTGIGRKSKLILDNLGISAVQLSEELKGVSLDASSIGEVADAVGRIAEKNLNNMAGFAENAATKLQRLAASWENVKVAIGDIFNSGGLFGRGVDVVTRLFDIFSSDNLTKIQKFQTYLVAVLNPQNLEAFTKALKQLDEELLNNKQIAEEAQNRINKYDAQLLINKYNGIQAAVEEFTKSFNNLNNVDMSTLSETELRQFSQFEAILKILQLRLNDVSKSQVNAIDTITEMEAEIKRLNEVIGNTNELDIKSIRGNQALIKEYEERIKKIKGLVDVNKELNQSDLDRARLMQMLQESQKDLPFFKSPSGETPEFEGDAPEDRDEAFDRMTERLIEKRNETLALLRDFNQSAWSEISSFAEGSLAIIGQRLGDSTVNVGKGLLMGLGKFLASFGRQLIALGVGAKGLQAIVKNPLNPAAAVAAIVGGAALIVAGNAIAANVSSGISSSVGGGSGRGSVYSAAVSGAAQNQFSYDIVIKGEDLHVVLSTYSRNRKRTSAISG